MDVPRENAAHPARPRQGGVIGIARRCYVETCIDPFVWLGGAFFTGFVVIADNE